MYHIHCDNSICRSTKHIYIHKNAESRSIPHNCLIPLPSSLFMVRLVQSMTISATISLIPPYCSTCLELSTEHILCNSLWYKVRSVCCSTPCEGSLSCSSCCFSSGRHRFRKKKIIPRTTRNRTNPEMP